jgi:hypothetical protein
LGWWTVATPAPHLPREQAYHEAINLLCDEAHILLANWPSLALRLETHLMADYGATPTHTDIDMLQASQRRIAPPAAFEPPALALVGENVA